MDRLEAAAAGRDRRYLPKQSDPNELLIQLEASAIRLKWSPLERANRSAMGRYRVTYSNPVSVSPPAHSEN